MLTIVSQWENDLHCMLILKGYNSSSKNYTTGESWSQTKYNIMTLLALTILKLFGIWPLLSQSKTLHFIEEIVKVKPTAMVAICGKLIQDMEQETIIEVLQKHKLSFMQKNCSHITNVDKTVIVFNEPQIQEFRLAFNKPGIQNSLTKNIWIIISEKSFYSIDKYFAQSRLKIGINANLFVVLMSNLGQELIQIIGMGTSNYRIFVMSFEFSSKRYNKVNAHYFYRIMGKLIKLMLDKFLKQLQLKMGPMICVALLIYVAT